MEQTGTITGKIDGSVKGTITGTYTDIVSGSLQTDYTGELKIFTQSGEPIFFNVNVKIN